MAKTTAAAKREAALPTNETVQAALAPYLNPWRLLNTTPEEIRGVIDDLFPGEQAGNLGSVRVGPDGKPHPQTAAEQAEEIIALLEAFREMLMVAAGGEMFTQAGDPREDEVGRDAEERFYAAEEKAGEVLRHIQGRYRLGFEAMPWGIEIGYVPDPEGEWVWWREEGELPSLAAYLKRPLGELIAILRRAKPSTVFVCENCGRIGPAERSRRRYCDAACRTAAYRRRLKSA